MNFFVGEASKFIIFWLLSYCLGNWVYCKKGYKDFGTGKLITGGKPCRPEPPTDSGLTMQKDGGWYKPFHGEKINGVY